MSSAPTICFDATGTLMEATASVGEIYHEVALEHGVDLPAWRLDDAFKRVMGQAASTRVPDGRTSEERASRETEWWFERIRQTFQATDSTVRFEDFPGFAAVLFRHYEGQLAWRARSGIPEALSALRAAGCFLAVTSNFDHRLPKILEALNLAGYFDLIEIPHLHGQMKPERSVFEQVARASAQPLDALIYVGDDKPEILAGISEEGLRVIDVRKLEPSASLADLLLSSSKCVASATLSPRPSGQPNTTVDP